MTLAPLLAAAPVVQAHVAAAVTALAATAGVVLLTKGSRAHVWTGRVFVAAMFITAATSFWITSLTPGRYSWIHLLSIVTLVTIPMAVLAIRRGQKRRHITAMTLNAMGLIIAGAFTLLPPRILHAVVFGPLELVFVNREC